MVFAELPDSGQTGVGYGLDPFSRVHVALHDNVADRLVYIAQGKHQEEGGVEPVVGSVDKGQYHEIHEGDLHDGAEGRISGGTVGVVLDPVAHADHRGHAVDEEHARADAVGLIAEPHGVEKRLMDSDECKAGGSDQAAAQVHKAPCPLVGGLVAAGPHLLAHQDRGSVGKAAEKGDDKAFQGPEYGHSGDGLFALMAEDDIYHHIADADEYLVAEDRETFLEILSHKGPVPPEMPGKCQDKRQFFPDDKAQQHDQVHHTCQYGPQRRSGCPHLRKTQFAEDQQIVEQAVGDNRGNASVEGDLHLFDGPEKSAYGHGENLKRVGKSHNPQVGDADGLDLLFVCVDVHDKFRTGQSQGGEEHADGHHEA